MSDAKDQRFTTNKYWKEKKNAGQIFMANVSVTSLGCKARFMITSSVSHIDAISICEIFF